MPELLASVHDVAPFHLERLRRTEEVLQELGVKRVTYLLVPDFHGRGRADHDDAFVAWCRRPRPFSVRWALHGYTHRDDAGGAGGRSAAERWKGKHMTGGEGEFLSADVGALRDRLSRGVDVFRAVLGARPDGFVAPAWLYTAALPSLLRAAGIRWTESHRALVDLSTAKTIASPVITWATRTPFRKWTSVRGTPLLLRLWRGRPLLRLAVHPFDFDHPDSTASIRRVWSAALAGGTQRFYDDVLA